MAFQNIQTVPNEIWLRIVINLSHRDLYVLSQVNRFFKAIVDDDYTWRAILVARYGEEAVPNANQANQANQVNQVNQANLPTCREVYEEKAQHIISVADKFDGPWFNDTRYWRKENCPWSVFGKVAYLNIVWWLDVRATIPAVAPGEYEIVWRLNLHNQGPLTMYAEPVIKYAGMDVPKAVLHNPSPQWKRANVGLGWVYMVVPNRLVVEERHGLVDVVVGMKDLESTKKRDLHIDYVQLVDVTGRAQDAPPPRTFIIDRRRVTQP